MPRFAVLFLGPIALCGCSLTPVDYDVQRASIATCYYGVTPDDVKACLYRKKRKDPAYLMAFQPGNGAFCSPDLDARECRDFLESANEPSLPPS